MNNLKKIFVLMAMSVASFSFAQTSGASHGEAEISASFCVTLDDASEIQTNYVADASALGWTSEAEAKKSCGFHSNNLVSYKPDYANGKILIEIHVDRTSEEKDVTWWNEYLLSLCK